MIEHKNSGNRDKYDNVRLNNAISGKKKPKKPNAVYMN